MSRVVPKFFTMKVYFMFFPYGDVATPARNFVSNLDSTMISSDQLAHPNFQAGDGLGGMSRAWELLVAVPALVLLLSSTSLWSLSAATSEEGAILLEVVRDWTSFSFPWPPGSDPCGSNWTYVACDPAGIHVITLNMSHKALRGSVPSSLSKLTSLRTLDLSNNKYCPTCGPWNKVTGDLAPLAALVNLETLLVTSNELDLASFPMALYNLRNIMTLKVDNTLIRGPWPGQLASLPNLQHLWLGNNSFSEPLPGPVLGSMLNLVELTVWNNGNEGVFPPELGNLVNLTYLNCNKCNLYGGLPPELGNLTRLKKLLLYKNNFTGPIPYEWRNMVSIVDMELDSNSLYGVVPAWLWQLPNLQTLRLSSNLFHGGLPPVINTSTAPSLSNVTFECNYLEGDRPAVSGNMTLKLDYNCFNNESASDYSICTRNLNCVRFQVAIANGACPPCPSDQHLLNSTLCICDANPEPKNSMKFGSLARIGVGCAIGLAVLALVFCFLLLRHKVRQHNKKSPPNFFHISKEGGDIIYNSTWDYPKGVQRFNLEELMKATHGFDKAHEIGEGGFGKVFVGNFPDARALAIKRAAPMSVNRQSGHDQFRNEVLLLSRLHHKNLVRLEGFCDETDNQILVYEYMQVGSLQKILHERHRGKTDDKILVLDWYKRLEIAVHVAQGLDYLHSFADPPVIHRDVKPSNILLDENLMAKVADFGISKESPISKTHVSTGPAGTAGYFDPQYFLRRQLTTASDVYSFGVVLLELITGRKAIHFYGSPDEETNLIDWTKLKMDTNLGIDIIVDPKLEGHYPRETYKKMVDLALKCSSFKKNDRPSMKVVLSLLEPLLAASARPPAQDAASPYSWQPWSSATLQRQDSAMHSLPSSPSPTTSTDRSSRHAEAANIMNVTKKPSSRSIEISTVLLPR